MTFISYAQNFEDVMLWRALKHVEHGFYIDIGAAWPDADSVTKAFYERGWRGINIEPNPELNLQLQGRRPHDRNLRLAVGDCEGILAMNFLDDTGLSTLDGSIAEKHEQAGWSLDRQEVQVSTLATIWEEHVPAGQDVHFLKVDVEGFEEAALRGNDWSKNRPWIVVVEATLPLSQVESHETWEPILLAANYRFSYRDGLNRFYVANEHPELLLAFKYPPNVFDDFVLSRYQEAETRATQAETRATQAETRAAQAETRAAQAETRAAQEEAMLKALYNSRSWQLTRPLRSLGKALQELRAVCASPSWRIRRFLRIFEIWEKLIGKRTRHAHTAIYSIRAVIHFLLMRPALKVRVKNLLARYPALEARARKLVGLAISGDFMQKVNTESAYTASSLAELLQGYLIEHDSEGSGHHFTARESLLSKCVLPVNGTPSQIIAELEKQIALSLEAVPFVVSKNNADRGK